MLFWFIFGIVLVLFGNWVLSVSANNPFGALTFGGGLLMVVLSILSIFV